MVGELSALVGSRYASVSDSRLGFLPEIRVDIGGATAGISRFTRLLLLLPQHFLHFECGGRSTLPSGRAFEGVSETLGKFRAEVAAAGHASVRLLLKVSRHLLDYTVAIDACGTNGDRLRLLMLLHCCRSLGHCARRFGNQRVGRAAHFLRLRELLLAGHGASLLFLG